MRERRSPSQFAKASSKRIPVTEKGLAERRAHSTPTYIVGAAANVWGQAAFDAGSEVGSGAGPQIYAEKTVGCSPRFPLDMMIPIGSRLSTG